MDSARTIKALTECGAVTAALKAEHDAIEDALRALTEAMLADANTATLTQIMDILLDFCVAHFDSEEQELLDNGYPETVGHASAHKALLRRFRVARTALSKGQIEATLDASDLLNSFHNHVARFDRPAHAHLLRKRIDSGEGDRLHHQTQLNQLYRVRRAGNGH